LRTAKYPESVLPWQIYDRYLTVFITWKPPDSDNQPPVAALMDFAKYQSITMAMIVISNE
jgi:hypothetical protein